MEETRRHLGRNDVGALKALSHPLRMRLLLALAETGPAMVGVLAERMDAAVGAVSYHLRTLGRHGLVAEAPELARDKRERWWRLVPTDNLSLTPSDFADDPVGQVATLALLQEWVEATAERMRQSVETLQSLPPEWQDVLLPSLSARMSLTREEVDQLNAEVSEVLHRYLTRGEAAGPGEDRRPIVYYFQPLT